MNRKALTAAFPATVSVLLGFLPLGMAFGLLMNAAGYGVFWSFLMSLTVYAGSAQFVGVELLAASAPLGQVALMTLILNFRHMVYGLSLLERFRGMGGRKLYMIFALPDETYAILSSSRAPEGVEEKDYCLAVALLNHIYWVAGSTLGGLLGAAASFNSQGADFAMTALFVVIALGQWEEAKSHLPALTGLGCAGLFLLLLGPNRFLIPALCAMAAVLLALRGRLDGADKEAAV